MLTLTLLIHVVDCSILPNTAHVPTAKVWFAKSNVGDLKYAMQLKKRVTKWKTLLFVGNQNV